MTIVDFSHLSRRERLDLISEIWESIEDAPLPLPAAQADELDRRQALLDEGRGTGRDAYEALADLRGRCRG